MKWKVEEEREREEGRVSLKGRRYSLFLKSNKCTTGMSVGS